MRIALKTVADVRAIYQSCKKRRVDPPTEVTVSEMDYRAIIRDARKNGFWPHIEDPWQVNLYGIHIQPDLSVSRFANGT